MRGARTALAAAWCGAAVASIGALVLLGWITGAEPLRAVFTGGIVMIPNTATVALCAGAALFLRARGRARPVALGSSVVVVAIASLTMVERLFDVSFGIDLLLFADAVRAYPYLPPGRMATNSTVGFTLGGVALLLSLVSGPSARRASGAARWLATVGLLIAGLAILGYLYGARPLYAVDQFAGMAIPTAISILGLHAGLLLVNAEGGWVGVLTGRDAGAALARRLLPATILTPIAFGWLWLLGRRVESFGRETGVAIFVVGVVTVIVLLVLQSARELRAADAARQAHLAAEATARRAAEEANRAKSDFLATMSHELRTPLNAIMGYQDLLVGEIAGPLNAAQRAQLGRIAISARHLLTLIEDVLSLSRLELGRERFDLRPVRVGEVLTEAVAIVEPMARAKRIALDWCPPAEEIVITSDAAKLRQVVINLLTNAVKFTDRGTVTLTLAAAPDAVRIAVRDEGIGIAPEHHEKIFESFWQVKQTPTRTAEGTGLGLTLSRRYARLLGGDLTVSSSLGEGAQFLLRLPR